MVQRSIYGYLLRSISVALGRFRQSAFLSRSATSVGGKASGDPRPFDKMRAIKARISGGFSLDQIGVRRHAYYRNKIL
jgi:hypothetical protein